MATIMEKAAPRERDLVPQVVLSAGSNDTELTRPTVSTQEMMSQRASVYWRLEDGFDRADALKHQFREVHTDFRQLRLDPDDAHDLIDDAWDELVPPCERTRQQYISDLVRHWEKTDPRSQEQRRKDAEFTARKYWLVSRDGVASAAQMQALIDGWGRDRQAKNKSPAQATIDAYAWLRKNKSTAEINAWLGNRPELKAWLAAGVRS